MQLQAIQQVNLKKTKDLEGQKQQTQQLTAMKAELDKEHAEQLRLQGELASLTVSLKDGQKLNSKQLLSLNARIKDLQAVAGLTPVNGPGVRIVLTDNPAASQGAVGPFVPGIVHDFDVLQVVNELRSAKADAIAVNGMRVTGITPIRCVGPAIYVNWEPVTAPFHIDALGDPKTLQSALSMPNGIVDNLRTNGAIGVKVLPQKKLALPATANVPTLKVAKVG